MRPLIQVFIIATLFGYNEGFTHVLFSALVEEWAIKLLVGSGKGNLGRFKVLFIFTFDKIFS